MQQAASQPEPSACCRGGGFELSQPQPGEPRNEPNAPTVASTCLRAPSRTVASGCFRPHRASSSDLRLIPSMQRRSSDARRQLSAAWRTRVQSMHEGADAGSLASTGLHEKTHFERGGRRGPADEARRSLSEYGPTFAVICARAFCRRTRRGRGKSARSNPSTCSATREADHSSLTPSAACARSPRRRAAAPPRASASADRCARCRTSVPRWTLKASRHRRQRHQRLTGFQSVVEYHHRMYTGRQCCTPSAKPPSGRFTQRGCRSSRGGRFRLRTDQPRHPRRGERASVRSFPAYATAGVVWVPYPVEPAVQQAVEPRAAASTPKSPPAQGAEALKPGTSD